MNSCSHLDVVVDVAPPRRLVVAPVAGELLDPVVHRLHVLRQVGLSEGLVVAEVARELLAGDGGGRAGHGGSGEGGGAGRAVSFFIDSWNG